MNTNSIRHAFNFAWTTFKANFGLLTSCVLTFFTSWIILEVLVITGQRLGFIWWLFAHLSFFVVFAGLEVGFIRICFAIHDGKQIAYSDIFQRLHLGAKFFLVQLIYFFTVLFGFVLLIVPGAYVGIKYSFYSLSFAEGLTDLKQSFRKSADISQSSMWSLSGFSIFSLLFNILGASILGVGLLVTVPVSVLMKVYIYQQLNSQ